MTGKGQRLIISDAMTESGPVRGALWMFNADGKGKKRKIETKSKELSGEKKRRKLNSESTEKKEDTVDGGKNDSEIAEGIPFEDNYHDSMDEESYKCYFEKSICQTIPKHSVIVIDIVNSLSSGKVEMFLCAACRTFTPHVNAWKR